MAGISVALRLKGADSPVKRRGNDGELYLFGTGTDRLRDMTLHAIKVLRTCHVIFYIHGDKYLKFLKTFCPDVRSFDGNMLAAMSDLARVEFIGKRVCEELGCGRKVAYVTYGHPVFFSDGLHLALYCRQYGYQCRVLPAVSCVDSISALMLEKGLDYFAHDMLILHANALVLGRRQLVPTIPAILIGVDTVVSNGTFSVLVKRLQEAYPQHHHVYGVRCSDGTQENIFFSLEIEQLRDLEPRMVPMLSLAIPCAA